MDVIDHFITEIDGNEKYTTSFCCGFISLIAFAQQPGAFNRPGGKSKYEYGSPIWESG